MKRELQTQQLIKEDAKRLCAKILKTIGPEKQIIAMNALYLAMQIVAAAEGKK